MSAQWNPGIWNPRTGSTPNSYLYRAEQYDSDLGLYYLRARYYNPLTGRFLSRDPETGKAKDPKTLHKYLYAGGDPVDAIDPSGRDLVSDVWLRVKSAALTIVTAAPIKHFVAVCLIEAGILTYLATEHPDKAYTWGLVIEGTGCSIVWLYFTG